MFFVFFLLLRLTCTSFLSHCSCSSIVMLSGGPAAFIATQAQEQLKTIKCPTLRTRSSSTSTSPSRLRSPSNWPEASSSRGLASVATTLMPPRTTTPWSFRTKRTTTHVSFRTTAPVRIRFNLGAQTRQYRGEGETRERKENGSEGEREAGGDGKVYCTARQRLRVSPTAYYIIYYREGED